MKSDKQQNAKRSPNKEVWLITIVDSHHECFLLEEKVFGRYITLADDITHCWLFTLTSLVAGDPTGLIFLLRRWLQSDTSFFLFYWRTCGWILIWMECHTDALAAVHGSPGTCVPLCILAMIPGNRRWCCCHCHSDTSYGILPLNHGSLRTSALLKRCVLFGRVCSLMCLFSWACPKFSSFPTSSLFLWD